MAKNVILTETGFKNIYRGYLKYIALQSGGVDNWEWYGDSLNAFLRDWYFENHSNHTIEDFNEQDYDFDTIIEEDPTLGVKYIDQEIFFVYRKGACE